MGAASEALRLHHHAIQPEIVSCPDRGRVCSFDFDGQDEFAVLRFKYAQVKRRGRLYCRSIAIEKGERLLAVDIETKPAIVWSLRGVQEDVLWRRIRREPLDINPVANSGCFPEQMTPVAPSFASKGLHVLLPYEKIA